MGWLWSTPNPAQSKDQATSPKPLAGTSTNGPGKTRDELAEAEFQAFLTEFHGAEASTAAPSSNLPPHQQRKPQSSSPKSNDGNFSPHPSTMSCTTAFDAAWFCQLPGGQFVHVYRYGTLRNCSEAWSRFWFCMRTNRGFMTDEARQERVRRYYQERERRFLQGPNSEQVWEARSETHPTPFGDSSRQGTA